MEGRVLLQCDECDVTREISGDAMVAYFQPLMVWLKQQNKDQKCGW